VMHPNQSRACPHQSLCIAGTVSHSRRLSHAPQQSVPHPHKMGMGVMGV
jgi:hypothetical protein